MKIELVFDDWIDRISGKSIYCSNRGVRANRGDFHSGSTFTGSIDLDSEQEEDIRASIEMDAIPMFKLYLPRNENENDSVHKLD